MIGNDGVVYNMNRMMRITVSVGKKTEVVEYCPQADTRLNARIEATIKFLPISGTASTRTGWVAKATIYNPSKTLVSLIQKPVWSIDDYYAAHQEDYYSAGGVMEIEAGYWNEKSDGAKSQKERADIGRGGYKSLITGYINTSSYYRRGTDNILEIWCFDKSSKANDDFNKQVKSTKATMPGYQQEVVNERKKPGRRVDKNENWYDAIKNVINEIATEKSPTVPGKLFRDLGVIVESDEEQRSIISQLRTSEDKLTRRDFETIYIHPPKGSPEDGYEPYPEFQNKMHSELVGRNLSINGNNIYTAVEQLEQAYPGGLRIWFNYNHQEPDGVTKYYIWEPGNVSGNVSFDALEEGGVVEIYNFQNMLETPSIDGAGNFTMKMLFNPKIVKNAFVRLRWDERLRFDNMISGYTQGVASTANLSAFYPSLRGGLYNIQTRAVANADGNIFNAKFRVGYVTHTLSTHKNVWQTEVKTTGVASLQDTSKSKPKGK